MRACCERRFGSRDLAGRTVAVIGAGHVGSELTKRLVKAKAKVLLADIDPDKRSVARQLGAKWTDPASAVVADVDVLAPCALGGVLDHHTVPRLRCRVVAGAANNQLAGESVADLLAARDILWAPDFVANAGGIINIAEELGGYDPAAARRRVRGIGEILLDIFDRADSGGTTPLAAAMDLARARLGAQSAGRSTPSGNRPSSASLSR
jgi:leucine dehydrogenase